MIEGKVKDVTSNLTREINTKPSNTSAKVSHYIVDEEHMGEVQDRWQNG